MLPKVRSNFLCLGFLLVLLSIPSAASITCGSHVKYGTAGCSDGQTCKAALGCDIDTDPVHFCEIYDTPRTCLCPDGSSTPPDYYGRDARGGDCAVYGCSLDIPKDILVFRTMLNIPRHTTSE
jgi:hypothetical protein